jgi:hypothetical protein
MSVAEAQDQFELQKAEQFIAETPRIDGIESVRVELGEDHSGDPAMWLVFTLRADLDANREWMRRFIAYAGVIQTKILHSGLKRFPYTRLVDAA